MKFLAKILFVLTLSLPTFAYADGCSLMKSVYDSGKYTQAYTVARAYASDGSACVEYYLGLMYIHGQGVKMDTRKGLEYMKSAANKKYQPAIDFFEKRPD